MRACFSELRSPTPCKVFMVRIHRSGESVLTQGVLFPLRYEQTVHGTISRFHNYWQTFGFSLTSAFLLGRDYHRVSLRQLQISKQDNHGVQRKFAFSRRFVRGGQSGRLKAFQAFQATIGFIIWRLLFWILDPESIPSISSNHWIHCLALFILNLASSRASDCARLCYSDHPFGH